MISSRISSLMLLLIAGFLLCLPASAAAADDFIIQAVPDTVYRVSDCAEGYATVQDLYGNQGVIDSQGRFIVSFGTYDRIDTFSEGYALVYASSGAPLGYIDVNGTLVIHLEGRAVAGKFHDGLARIGNYRADGTIEYMFIDASGKTVLDCSDFAEVGEFSCGYAKVGVRNGESMSYGFINTSGEMLIGNLLDASDFSDGYAYVTLYNSLSRKNVVCLLDTSGTTTADLSLYSDPEPVSDGLILVPPQSGTTISGYGYADRTGKLVIDCSDCEFIYPFSDGLALTEYLNAAGTLCYAYIDRYGETVIDLGACESAFSFCDGYAIYKDHGSWYLMDTMGNVTYSSRTYTSFDSFSEGVLIASRAINDTYYFDFLTYDGAILAENLRYDSIDSFSNSLALATLLSSDGNYHFYFLDMYGNLCLDCSDCDSVICFSEGLLPVSRYSWEADYFSGSSWYFVDKDGETVLDCSEYSSVQPYSDGLALVTLNDAQTLETQFLFIDSNGNSSGDKIPDCSGYTSVSSFYDGYSIVSKIQGNKTVYALMDLDGSLVTDWLDYNSMSGWSDGYAVVNFTETVGSTTNYQYLSPDGTIALTCSGYDLCRSFSDGYAVVKQNDFYYLIDKNGNKVQGVEFDDIFDFSNGSTWGLRSGIWYSISISGYTDTGSGSDVENTTAFGSFDTNASLESDNSELPDLTNVKLPFSDVEPSAWYYQSIQLAYASDMMNGVSSTIFDPDSSVTLAQAITMAVRAYCSCLSLPEISISDRGLWYQPYVDFAIEKGIIKRGDFSDYNSPASRAQLAYLFYNVLQSMGWKKLNTVSTISDVGIWDPYYQEIIGMYEAGILTGYPDGTFLPENSVKRCEVAAIITRVIYSSQRRSM